MKHFLAIFFLGNRNDALDYAERARAIKPARYNSSFESRKRKNIDEIVQLEVKTERVQHIQNELRDLNERIIDGAGCEAIDISLSDIEAYEEALTSDEDNNDESDYESSNESDSFDANTNDNAHGKHFQVDAEFSGNYEFFIDVIIVFILIYQVNDLILRKTFIFP